MDNTTTDLIAQKTGEFDKLPGLLLGLDGWILRSVPHEFRKQFLQGYEKLLRVAFHPDRYQNEVTKQSRQNYLQAVAEAVEYMSRDEFSFEIASEAVPTKRNPFVALQQKIDLQDQIISRISDQIDETKSEASKSTNSEHSLRKQLETIIDRTNLEVRSQSSLKGVVAQLSRSFPVPLGCRMHSVTGSFVDFNRPVEEPTLFENLDRLSIKDTYCADSPWFKEEGFFGSFEPYLEKTMRLQFNNFTTRPDRCKTPNPEKKGKFNIRYGPSYRIMGAMTVAHLCEFIRSQRAEKLSVRKSIDRLLFEGKPVLSSDNLHTWRQNVMQYFMPFYVPGSLLIINVYQKSGMKPVDDNEGLEGELRLFLVKTSDYSQAPDQAAVAGYKAKLADAKFDYERKMERHWFDMGNRGRKVMLLKHELADLRKWVQILQKHIERSGGTVPTKPQRLKKERRVNGALSMKPLDRSLRKLKQKATFLIGEDPTKKDWSAYETSEKAPPP